MKHLDNSYTCQKESTVLPFSVHPHRYALQLSNHLLSLVDPSNSVRNQLINKSLCALLLIHYGSSLAHQVGAGRVHYLIGNLVSPGLEIMLNGDYSLARQVLDLLRAVLFPVLDIRVVANTHRATCEDDRADIVIEASSLDGLLVSLGGAGLIGQDESGTDPDSAGAEHQSSSDGLSIVDTTCSNNLHGLAGHGAGLALAELDHGGDQDSRRGISGVSTTLASLGADDIHAEVKALLDVLWVSNHVHVQDTGLVESLDDMLRGNTDGRHEQLGSAFNNDSYELVELSLRVIIAVGKTTSAPE